MEKSKYKYYKFVYESQPNEQNTTITFELTPHHGDSDLYMSSNAKVQFPDSMNYTMKS